MPLRQRILEPFRRAASRLIFRKLVSLDLKRPIISFSFDDFPESAIRCGGAILHKHGLRGTFYASLGLMGKDTATGRLFGTEDLTPLVEQGHELGCHTFSHCHSGETRSDIFERAIRDNRVRLRQLLPSAEFRSFAYPISLPRPFTKRIAGKYFSSCRGGGQTFNSGTIDLNNLSAYFLEKSVHNIDEVKEVINRNDRSRGWLIFATHDITDNPSSYGCPPAFFEEIVRFAIDSGARILPVTEALQVGLGKTVPDEAARVPRQEPEAHRPLVSILIPAYNASSWIGDSIRSAMDQTWDRKEIIVVDDGSTDDTLAIARRFECEYVRVIRQENRGAAAARNTAFRACHGDYIQWLDADDLLEPEKISRQIAAIGSTESKKTLFSSAWGRFIYRPRRAKFVPTALWRDHRPIDWLLLKLSSNLYMQTATWLVSRELAEAAGDWDTSLLGDDDGEYFCRVILASDRIKFVPESVVFYRGPGVAFGGSLSYIYQSDRKLAAHWSSMRMHIDYLLSLEDSDRARDACSAYLHANLVYFYPDRTRILNDVAEVARSIGRPLGRPLLRGKYFLLQQMFGWKVAIAAQAELRRVRWRLQRQWDMMMFRMECIAGSAPILVKKSG